ncbi:MAG: acyl-CoA thioesterase [Planctomycetota bacterium]|jgi:acyl-CoA thioester hydrolase|nr:acyl-CoA thioesterase [Planctomycetota bacterium]
MPEAHLFTYRVSYGDTDRMDRVYYANYLEICERARGELLRTAGFPYRKIEDEGFFFPVRRCRARYFGWAVYDDLLLCRTRITRFRHATLVFATDIFRGESGKPLVSAEVELACVDADGKPRLIPAKLRASLASYAEGGPC